MASVSTEKAAEYVVYHSGSAPSYRKVQDNASSGFTSIPTIDIVELRDPSATESTRLVLAAQIFAACSDSGFFYIKNHGIPQELIDETFLVIKRFFSLDLDTKMEAHSSLNPAIRGYEPMFWTKLDSRTKGGETSLCFLYVKCDGWC